MLEKENKQGASCHFVKEHIILINVRTLLKKTVKELSGLIEKEKLCCLCCLRLFRTNNKGTQCKNL